MAIKTYMTLEGVDQMQAQLQQLVVSGERMLQQFRTAGQGLNLPDVIQPEVAVNIERATNSTREFRDIVHTLRPILAEAGVAAGGFGSFVMASRAGVTGLAIAITASLVVALSKLADSAAVARTRLETLLNVRPGAGGSAMTALEKDAAKLGMTADTVQPAIEKFTGALRQAKAATGAVWISPPGQPLPAILAQDFAKAEPAALGFIAALRTYGATQKQAADEAARFADSLKKTQTVNGDVIRSLDPLGGGVKAVGEALGLSGLNAEQLADRLDKMPRSLDELVRGLLRIGPDLIKAFETRPITEFDDALHRVGVSWGQLWKDISTSKFGVGVLDVIARMPEDFRAAIEAMKKDYADAKAFLSQAIKPGRPITPTTMGVELGLEDIDKLSSASQKAASLAWQGWNDVSDSIIKVGDDAVAAGNKMLQELQKVQTQAQSTAKWISPQGTIEAPTALTSLMATAAPTEQTTQTLVAPFQEADNQIRTVWLSLMDYISTALNEIDLSGLTIKLVQPFIDALPGISQVIQQVQQMIYELMLQIALADAAVNRMGSFGIGGSVNPRQFGGAASGGFIRGPGSTTSDSILAWLSDREYVINAKAVSHYGTSLFNALNSMRLPRDIFGPMPRFAQGGMVPATAGGTPVTLVIDRQSFNMTAGDDTISRLKRYAVASQLSSTGRKPRWVR